MRKLFLLIPVMLISLIANAKVTNINNSTADALRLALYNSTAGDTIVMAEGIYEESNSDYIAWRRSNVVMAAEGATVTIKPHVSFRVRNGARAELIGVKIDASEIGSYKNIFDAHDANDGNRLILQNCEIYGNPNQSVVYWASDKKLDSLIINNCYIHDNAQVSLRLETTSLKGVIITNSTFANMANGGSFWCAPIDIKNTAADAKVIVDHCTFYHNTSISSSYADITTGVDGTATSDVTITNCIFAQPESYSGSRAINLTNGGTVRNCLTFNYTKSTNGIQGETVRENCVVADPLFTDAANGDYSFPGNWVTPSISPARGAATDGSDLGDPRWYSAETLPETDFSPSYIFLGEKAMLSGSFALNGDNYIQSQDKSYAGIATWKIEAERKCVVNVTLNIAAANTSGHRYEVALYDADNNLVGTALAEPSNSWSAGDKVLGSYEIPAAGNYVVKLTNDCANSSTIIEGITFTYLGGEVQAMPGTTNIADAWFSSNGTRADGKITYPENTLGWAKWNINVAAAGTYNVTVNIQNVYGHNYAVEFLKEGESTPISIDEGGTTYGHDATLYPVEVGAVALEAGNYEMKVSNAIGDAALLSVTLAYAGGAAIDLSKTTPASLLANADAILSDDWSIEGGKITYAESKALTGWAKWNVDCADAANYNVTINIESTNGHLMRVEVFENEAEPAIYTLDETETTHWSTGTLAIDLGNVNLSAHEYVVKVTNTQSSSAAKIASIDITYKGGAVVNIPNANIPLADAICSTRAFTDAEGLHFTDADHLGTISGEYAKWNIAVANEGLYKFTAHCSSTNYSNLTIAVYDGETEVYTYTPQYTYNQADKEISSPEWLLDAGNYVLKLSNPANNSNGYLLSLSASVAENIIILDEMATDNSVIHANNGENAKKILLKRTFKGSMYNTICLPFSDWSSSLELVFGAGYELLELSSAELEGDVLNLNFNSVTSLGHGRPYLIKPEQDVVNPIFGTGHTIDERTDGYNIKSCTNADFIGSFIKGEVPAGENNLFLGTDNTLYFSNTATPIKGMRAYFYVNVPNPQQVIRRANIVTPHGSTTAFELVETQSNGSVKTIENGQLIIIRDGVRYNVMGVKIQ